MDTLVKPELSEQPESEQSEKPKGPVTFAKQIKQMMYVSGETAEPSAETTGMIEEIVRQQVIEMVRPLFPELDILTQSFPIKENGSTVFSRY